MLVVHSLKFLQYVNGPPEFTAMGPSDGSLGSRKATPFLLCIICMSCVGKEDVELSQYTEVLYPTQNIGSRGLEFRGFGGAMRHWTVEKEREVGRVGPGLQKVPEAVRYGIASLTVGGTVSVLPLACTMALPVGSSATPLLL